MINTNLIWLNNTNGADKVCASYHKRLMDEFSEPLIGVIMGSAYGGELEYLGKLWKDRGQVYGCDVFEALHPKHLADDPTQLDATCMDVWYNENVHGVEKMKESYQREELDKLGLSNVHLRKGEVSPDSCKDLDKIHYALLDMDIPFSMDQGYKGVREKIVKGGYLLLHDTQTFSTVNEWFENEVIGKDKKMWKLLKKYDGEMLVALQRV